MNASVEYLRCALKNFRDLKKLGERALEQLTLEEIHVVPGPESNSIAIIVKHLAGNMRSRWTDFSTSDGEKPDRDRDAEFEGGYPSREALMQDWEEGWAAVFAAIESLTPDDLLRTVTIRGEPHSVIAAIQRQISHYAYHVGQMVFFAKQLKKREWKSLSIPRGQSRAYLKQKLKESGTEKPESPQ
jgi:hypothetical protein